MIQRKMFEYTVATHHYAGTNKSLIDLINRHAEHGWRLFDTIRADHLEKDDSPIFLLYFEREVDVK